MRSNFVYDFNRQEMFRLGYIARKIRSSRGHEGQDENNMTRRASLSAKSKWD